MDNQKDFQLSSYDFSLDSERIAQFPAEPRHAARLLVVQSLKNKYFKHLHKTVWDWTDELRSGDLVVVNDTRVLKARLTIRLPGGGKGELLLLEPRGNSCWLCLARPGRKIRPGDNLQIETIEKKFVDIQVLSKDEESGGRIVKFPDLFQDREHIELFLERYGQVPLPPYIHRYDSSDEEKYQTLFATRPGAVAAPTAGLHLSEELIQALNKKGVKIASITLHIGLGTFKPLEIEDLTKLSLHSEWVEVSNNVIEAINICRDKGGRVIAVGTTSVRALEGAFLAGDRNLKPFNGLIDLVIKPGHRFGVVDGLLTNFHLPKSSLLMLVSAFIGRERLLSLYAEAIKQKYRFFSYGDAMWIKPEAVIPEAKEC